MKIHHSPDDPLLGERCTIELRVNGETCRRDVEVRLLLSDFLRHELGLTGTHVGCEQGICGACTIQIEGQPVRSCLMFAVQADGCSLRTVEDLASGPGEAGLHPLQRAFWQTHALQCGFCTPGILMTLDAYLRDHPAPDEADIRTVLGAHLCRCTGYINIVDAALQAAAAAPSRSNEEDER